MTTPHDEREPRPATGADYLGVQREAFRALLTISGEAVDPVESAVEQRFAEERDATERDCAAAVAKSNAAYDQAIAPTERSYAERVARIEADYDTARHMLGRKIDKSLKQIHGLYETTEAESRRLGDDDLLMADTAGTATIKGLYKEHRALHDRVKVERQRLDVLQAQALAVLAEFGRKPPAEAPAPDDDDADDNANGDDHDAAVSQQVETLAELLHSGRTRTVWLGVLCALPAVAAVPVSLFEIAPWFVSVPFALVAGAAIAIPVARRMRRTMNTRVQETFDTLQRTVAAIRRALDRELARSDAGFARRETRAQSHSVREAQTIHHEYQATIQAAARQRDESLRVAQAGRAAEEAAIEQQHAAALREARQWRTECGASLQAEKDAALTAAQERYDQRTAACRRDHQAARAELAAQWDDGLACLRRLVEETARLGLAPPGAWDAGAAAAFEPPAALTSWVPFGHWRIARAEIAASVRERVGFLVGPAEELTIPALLAIPERCSLLLEADRAGRDAAIATLRAVMLRLLTSLPPGSVRFTILDPVGLGESFAGFMHLVDYEDALVGGRIWTESEHIEARLTELTSHMENVIQKYLRNEFATIDEYNKQAGQLAEPYRFLVVADLPVNFSEQSARRLSSIVNSGARCGVFTLIAHDKRQPTPPELDLDGLADRSIHLTWHEGRFRNQDELLGQFPLTLDAPPPEDVLTTLMHAVGRGAKDSLRVEVPFASIAPTPEQCWSRSAIVGLEVAIGHTGAVRRQHLRLGRGIAQHGLIAGKTGSGKSTLLHVAITNFALWYSPEELEMYLVDFKKGVEFKTYVTHGLPHARAIAIESDREFGVSVLERLEAEMGRRGDLFRDAGVQDLAGYREATGQCMARTLLIVDEFQVFFAQDDKLSQDAGLLLDSLVRQGRAFGIHVLLGSQTLAGTAGLARSTTGQMAVRIALQCAEADAQLILDDTNLAARLLTRPGEAVYNDAGGRVEGNSPFQTAWLPDPERTRYLERVAQLARERNVVTEPPIVFEGNAPADIRRNRILQAHLQAAAWPEAVPAPCAWLGEAVAIKDPTSVTFRRQAGSNVLLVGQRDDAALAMMAATMLALAAQLPPSRVRFVVLDGRPTDDQRAGPIRAVADVLPHETRFVAWRDVGEAIAALAAETQRRLDADEHDAPTVVLLVYGLQRYRMLRRQEDSYSFSPAAADEPPAPDRQFADLLGEGPSFGLHTLVWADTLATAERTLDRASLGQFDHHVLFQMSAADSSNLIDSPDANRLGFYRALLYSEEHGLLEKFRPYAAPDERWLGELRSESFRFQISNFKFGI